MGLLYQHILCKTDLILFFCFFHSDIYIWLLTAQSFICKNTRTYFYITCTGEILPNNSYLYILVPTVVKQIKQSPIESWVMLLIIEVDRLLWNIQNWSHSWNINRMWPSLFNRKQANNSEGFLSVLTIWWLFLLMSSFCLLILNIAIDSYISL